MRVTGRKKDPVGRFTTHKPRSVWFQQASAFPVRDADPTEVERRMFLDPFAPPQAWEAVGPVNFAGRVTCLALDSKNNLLYAGAAAGGVWRSPDLGKTWIPPSPVLHPPNGNTNPSLAGIKAWPTNNIGALLVDPHNPDHVLCATGEANGSADAYPGCGIFHSPDRGATWYVLAYTTDTGLPRRIGALAIDPVEPKNMLASGITHMESEAGGLFQSSDGGVTWNVVDVCGKSYQCYAAVYDGKGNIFFTVDMRGTGNGICQLNTGELLGANELLPDNIEFGRTSLAVSRSHPETIYALAGDRRGGLLGIFRTVDSGRHWAKVGRARSFPLEDQFSYTNCIAVHPGDPDFVAIGGLDIHISRDGGKHWRAATDDSVWPDKRGSVHGDHHALIILENGTIITGCDGGVYVSPDLGKHWESRSDGMQTTMFYAMDVAPKDCRSLGGGCQDNGTLVRDGGDPPNHFRYVIGGDGAWLAYDCDDAENIFGGYHEAHVFRHKAKPRSRWVNVSPRIRTGERKVRAIAVLDIEPLRRKRQRNKRVYLGTNRLWCTANWGKTWKPVSPVFDNTPISAIAIAPHDPGLVMVGTSKGGIYRLLEDGTWSENFAGAAIPMRLISSIRIFRPPTAVDHNDTCVICTVAGIGLRGMPVPQVFRKDLEPDAVHQGYSHVFVSAGSGEHGWKDADGARLPDMAYQCCAFEERPPFRVFIGGDFGVFMAGAEGFRKLKETINVTSEPVAKYFHWVNITGNLPNVIVSDLVYHAGEGALYASTYGRGIYRLDLGSDKNLTIFDQAPTAAGIESGWIQAQQAK